MLESRHLLYDRYVRGNFLKLDSFETWYSETCDEWPLWWKLNLWWMATVMEAEPVMNGHCDGSWTCDERPL